MSEQLAWAQWWALPWRSAHTDWALKDKYARLDALCLPRHAQVSTTLDIQPCPPPAPHATVLRLALASQEQLGRMLSLLSHTCHLSLDNSLSGSEHLWCLRLSKALNPEALLFADDDPLQLLRAWVDPGVWQRLRLRFPSQRVVRLEHKARVLEDAHSRLDTLWQAIVWRITTPPHEESQPSQS